jgi:hypothetical protein
VFPTENLAASVLEEAAAATRALGVTPPLLSGIRFQTRSQLNRGTLPTLRNDSARPKGFEPLTFGSGGRKGRLQGLAVVRNLLIPFETGRGAACKIHSQ